MMSLAPGSYFRTASIPQYKQLYFEGLRHLDPQETVEQIEKLANGKDAALLCYEKPDDDQYCHRAYISVWLFEALGIEVFEYGLEDQGCAWKHPKLPDQYRLGPKPEPLDVGPWLGSEAKDKTGRNWRVVGCHPVHVDQACIMDTETGERNSISKDVLEAKFQRVA